MIKLRPWKGSKNEFEVDIIVGGVQGQTLRRRLKAPVTGRTNAERWARTLEQELFAQLLALGQAPDPKSGAEPQKLPAPTLHAFAREFLELCETDRLGINTRMNYDVHLRLYLLPALGRRRLDEITPQDITKLKKSLSKKSHNTSCEVLKTLRRVLNRAIAEKKIECAPVEFDIPRRVHRLPIAYDDQEQEALLAAAQALGPMYVAIVLLGIDGGLRRGEILGLQWADIALKRAEMVIRHNVVRGKLDAPKGRTEDNIGITKRLAQALETHPRTGPFVFDNKGSHFKEHNMNAWMRALVKLAGLPWRGTHVLRKTCGTRIADGGGGVAAVATHLRHKDLGTASRYIDRRGATSRALKALES
ncbi:tyrosine-type recombinase/integrase [Nannocystis bainbridge]|uniref:Tyrosine-type recombinase/integrase n=1 Tax=Nannocystis bainbridge TaxID=2995303 RepID=A0ABT5E4W4_9BACT|nr:tyrosine-type recombinase/integrase [Nannocystis bainbridge]MDC0720907.1 tyrosine-type recombinase/integrase [Nannocystis bainbridge]